jgi:hypothetical protein
MDFIERILGVSPDGGDGSTEMLYIVSLLAVLGAFAVRAMIRRRVFGRHD